VGGNGTVSLPFHVLKTDGQSAPSFPHPGWLRSVSPLNYMLPPSSEHTYHQSRASSTASGTMPWDTRVRISHNDTLGGPYYLLVKNVCLIGSESRTYNNRFPSCPTRLIGITSRISSGINSEGIWIYMSDSSSRTDKQAGLECWDSPTSSNSQVSVIHPLTFADL